MSGTLRERVQRALIARDELAKATEHLNEQLRGVEDIFAARLSAHIEARVPLYDPPPENPIEFLVFARGFFYIEWRDQRQLLLSSSREKRLLAAGRLQALWAACGGA